MDKEEILAQLSDAVVADSLKDNLISGWVDTEEMWNSMKNVLTWYMTSDDFDEWCEENDIGDWDDHIEEVPESKCGGDCSSCECKGQVADVLETPTPLWPFAKAQTQYEEDTSNVDRFDLEQEMLECWRITSDIKLLAASNATDLDYEALVRLYEFRFEKMWNTFEALIANKQL